jgi:hypothetical protein
MEDSGKQLTSMRVNWGMDGCICSSKKIATQEQQGLLPISVLDHCDYPYSVLGRLAILRWKSHEANFQEVGRRSPTLKVIANFHELAYRGFQVNVT